MTSTNELLARLDRDPAPGWRPSPGDAVAGQVVEVTSGTSDYSDAYPIVVLRKADGNEIAVHCFHSVLRREVAKRGVRVGDTMAVRFLGRHQSKTGGSAYDAYRMVVEQSRANAELAATAALRAAGSSPAAVRSAAVPVPAVDYEDGEEPF